MPFQMVYSRKLHTAYVDLTCTLDIETTNTQEDGFIYSIALCIAGECIVVRYVEDLISILKTMITHFRLSDKRHIVIYVHNLGYEHMYLTQILSDVFERKSILLTGARKPLTIKYGFGLEFRDSLKLFQKSLVEATKNVGHKKLAGDLDYSVYRSPDTPLNQLEFDYVVNDVVGLYEAIEDLKKEHGYNQASIPLTNTGIVIEHINRVISKDKRCLKAMSQLELDKDQICLAYHCMAGGDTHGCRWRAGGVYENCNSYDFKSAHPSQQLLRKFPTGHPVTLPENINEETLRLLIDSDYGWIAKVYISDLNIRPECPDPCISYSKCPDVINSYGLDNGRLLGADHVFCYIDSNDYQRIKDAYTYTELVAVESVAFKLDYLPESYRKVIKDYYMTKESAEDGPERNFAKVCVNTIFGASAQKLIRDEWTITERLETEHISWEQNLDEKTPEQVHKKQIMRFPFLWGLWTASCTRLELWHMLKLVGWEKVIYWDTDSCKYQGAKIPEIESYNSTIREMCIIRHADVINRKGQKVYIGSAEDEHKGVDYGYKRFTFLHAKCYACESWSDKDQCYNIESTIAGVAKDAGVKALDGDISNLKSGLRIYPAGGQKLWYHDRDIYTRTDFERPTRCASYIYMVDREYLVNDRRSLIYDQEVIIQ